MTTAQAATTNGGVIDTLTAVIIVYAVLESPPWSSCGC